jgi:pimeloyl-ACP methyl ester carboxylesterase
LSECHCGDDAAGTGYRQDWQIFSNRAKYSASLSVPALGTVAPMFDSRVFLWLLPLLLVLSDCVTPDTPGVPNPPLSAEKGVVALFSGWTPEGSTNLATGMYGLTQELRAIGIRANFYTPQQWPDAARALAEMPDARSVPIAMVGYSLGGKGVTSLADALRRGGIPVQTLVTVEAWEPIPVACNVRMAVDIFAPEIIFALSSRLQPGPGFTGQLQRVEYNPHGGDLFGHFTISVFDSLHRFIRDIVLDGDRVRRFPPTAGEAACSAVSPGPPA